MKKIGLHLSSATSAFAVLFYLAACSSIQNTSQQNKVSDNTASITPTTSAETKPEAVTIASTSDLKNASTPKVPQDLSLKDIAADLNLSVNSLKTQSASLAQYMEHHREPTARQCSTTHSAVCKIISSLKHRAIEDEEEQTELESEEELAQNTLVSSGVLPVAEEIFPQFKPLLRKHFALKPTNFSSLQRVRYKTLVKSLKRIPAERVAGWVDRILETEDCPRYLSLAALRFLESQLPQKETQEKIEKLYTHASVCLKTDDPEFGITHLRQALLRKLWGNEKGARDAIQKAMLGEVDKDQDQARILYWAGTFESDEVSRNKYWNRLLKEHPMTLHALHVAAFQNKDPMSVIQKRPVLQSDRQTNDAEAQTSVQWLESLYMIQRPQAAGRFASWMIDRFDKKLSDNNILYMSSLKTPNTLNQSGFSFIGKCIERRPQLMNKQFLSLLFPKTYFDVFEKNGSGTTDTYLVLSVAKQESAFNPKAHSHANARGLLQLLPRTARIVLKQRRPNLYDVEVNAKAGIQFLESLAQKLGSVEHALAGYNAGPGRIDQWKERYPTEDLQLFIDLIPFKETRNYVSAILRNNYWYARLYDKESKSPVVASRIVKDLVGKHTQISQNLEAAAGVPADLR